MMFGYLLFGRADFFFFAFIEAVEGFVVIVGHRG